MAGVAAAGGASPVECDCCEGGCGGGALMGEMVEVGDKGEPTACSLSGLAIRRPPRALLSERSPLILVAWGRQLDGDRRGQKTCRAPDQRSCASGKRGGGMGDGAGGGGGRGME